MSPAAPRPLGALRNPVGTHVRVGTGLVKGALARADEIGAEAMQVFVGNPRGWAPSAGDPRVDRAFRTACEAGIGLGAFEELFAHPATEGVPFVLETPGSRDADDPQIPLLQKLRDG